MDGTLIQTFNAFFLAAVVLAVPVLIIAGIWVAAVELRRPVSTPMKLRSAPRSARRP